MTAQNPRSAPVVMVDPVTYAVLSLCECCCSGCDCGCVCYCPLPAHRARAEGGAPCE